MPDREDVQSNVWTIGNGRLVTNDRIIDDGLVVIAGTRIVYAGSRAEYVAGDAAATVDVDARGGHICPGFIDIHVHGGGGADVMDGTAAALHTIACVHARHGTTGLLATTMTAPHDELAPVVRTVREAVEGDQSRQRNRGDATARVEQGGAARILGLHLEGPYVNPLRAGAQNPQHMRAPSLMELKQLHEAAGHCLRTVTLAPELPGAPEAIDWLTERGIVVSMGHSAATYAEAQQAVAAGATVATHTFNGMNSLHHREPGLLGAVLNDDSVFAELIADGLHVHPAVMRLLYRLKGAARLILVTDCMRARGCGDGEYSLGDLVVSVRDNEARLRTDIGDAPGSLAGSLLTMDTAVRTMVRDVGVSLREAVRMASQTPAAAIGLQETKGSLEKGKDADVVVLDEALNVQTTVVGGRVVYSGQGWGSHEHCCRSEL